MSNYDLYKELDFLKKYLTQDGEDELVKELNDVVSIGATGTEIFMHVRYLLQEFIKNNNTTNPFTDKKVKEIIAYLNGVLDS